MRFLQTKLFLAFALTLNFSVLCSEDDASESRNDLLGTRTLSRLRKMARLEHNWQEKVAIESQVVNDEAIIHRAEVQMLRAEETLMQKTKAVHQQKVQKLPGLATNGSIGATKKNTMKKRRRPIQSAIKNGWDTGTTTTTLLGERGPNNHKRMKENKNKDDRAFRKSKNKRVSQGLGIGGAANVTANQLYKNPPKKGSLLPLNSSSNQTLSLREKPSKKVRTRENGAFRKSKNKRISQGLGIGGAANVTANQLYKIPPVNQVQGLSNKGSRSKKTSSKRGTYRLNMKGQQLPAKTQRSDKMVTKKLRKFKRSRRKQNDQRKLDDPFDVSNSMGVAFDTNYDQDEISDQNDYDDLLDDILDDIIEPPSSPSLSYEIDARRHRTSYGPSYSYASYGSKSGKSYSHSYGHSYGSKSGKSYGGYGSGASHGYSYSTYGSGASHGYSYSTYESGASYGHSYGSKSGKSYGHYGHYSKSGKSYSSGYGSYSKPTSSTASTPHSYSAPIYPYYDDLDGIGGVDGYYGGNNGGGNGGIDGYYGDNNGGGNGGVDNYYGGGNGGVDNYYGGDNGGVDNYYGGNNGGGNGGVDGYYKTDGKDDDKYVYSPGDSTDVIDSGIGADEPSAPSPIPFSSKNYNGDENSYNGSYRSTNNSPSKFVPKKAGGKPSSSSPKASPKSNDSASPKIGSSKPSKKLNNQPKNNSNSNRKDPSIPKNVIRDSIPSKSKKTQPNLKEKNPIHNTISKKTKGSL